GRTLVRPLATRSRSAFFPYTTLFRSQQAVEEVAPAEFRLVELGREVVVIEEEFLAQQLEESPDQHEQVRRVAGVHDVEAAREEAAPRQDEGRWDRARILQAVPKGTRGLPRQPIWIDVDGVD